MTSCEVNGVGLKVIMGCPDRKGREGGGGLSGVRGSRLKDLISNEGSEMIALDGVV